MKTRMQIQLVALLLFFLTLFIAPAASAQDNCYLKVNTATIMYEGFFGEAGPLINGTVINRDVLCRVNFRADLCQSPVGSVKFVLDNTTTKIENSAPYAFWGDVNGSYKIWVPVLGTHTIVITAYSGANATGQAGAPLTIHFSVTGSQTSDACRFPPGTCPNGCDDASECTNDQCVNGTCQHTQNNCDDNNLCTDDACNSGVCAHTAILASSSYLKIENLAKSWLKLKLGYSGNLWSPKQDVTAGGNTQLCITLRAAGYPTWNKIQIRPQGSAASAVTLGNYISGGVPGFTTFCIPLSAFTGFTGFTQLSYMELPYSNGADPFEIDIQKIEFTGGATPFLWFGDPHTSNATDNGSVGALKATLISGSPCDRAAKMSGDESTQMSGTETTLSAYPNPFNEQLNFEFTVQQESPVSLELFTVAGAKVATIYEGKVESGTLHKETFHPENLAPGFYVYRLKTNASVITNKILLVR